jgi:DNA repair protein RecO (recombination protein O)
MLQKDEGVVLKVARSGETSLLVTMLSRKLGKVRLMAKGALLPKQSTRGLLETGNHLETVYYYKENRTVYYLKETSLLSPSAPDRDSLPHMAVRLAAMELLDQVCYPGSADETIVGLAIEFGRVEASADPLTLFLAFELKLLAVLGAFPEFSGCALCGGDATGGVYDAADGVAFCPEHLPGTTDALPLRSDVLRSALRFAEQPLAETGREELEPSTRKDLGKIVHWTYTHHVQGYSLPKSLSLI